ncbi:hypothetical protein [Aeromicrobium sp. UC242_57]|uniref:hypothetical protein n=1 Tax=Aeromicrobium sp. UC242_57 TaxID=3374624 RepID=UPI0037898E2D
MTSGNQGSRRGTCWSIGRSRSLKYDEEFTTFAVTDPKVKATTSGGVTQYEVRMPVNHAYAVRQARREHRGRQDRRAQNRSRHREGLGGRTGRPGPVRHQGRCPGCTSPRVDERRRALRDGT